MVTPQEDADRLSERIWIEYGNEIYDKETFNTAFDDYMGEDLTAEQDTLLRKQTFKFTEPKIKRAERFREKKEKVIVSKKPTEEKKPVKRFTTLGKAKKVIVYGYAEQITRNKKQITIYRDRRGRFIKPIK